MEPLLRLVHQGALGKCLYIDAKKKTCYWRWTWNYAGMIKWEFKEPLETFGENLGSHRTLVENDRYREYVE